MMKSLYDDNDRYTNAANDFDLEVYRAIQPIFDKWVSLGFSIRDLACITRASVNNLELGALLSDGDSGTSLLF